MRDLSLKGCIRRFRSSAVLVINVLELGFVCVFSWCCVVLAGVVCSENQNTSLLIFHAYGVN
jgi:hypothetical protein